MSTPTELLYNPINVHSHLRLFHHHYSHSKQGHLLQLPPVIYKYVCTNKIYQSINIHICSINLIIRISVNYSDNFYKGHHHSSLYQEAAQ